MIRLDQPALKTIEHQVQQIEGGISCAQGALRIGGVDAAIHDYARDILKTDKADYYGHSIGLAPLRQKLADTLSAKYKARVAFENVIVTHGSINGIAALCFLLLQAGDEVVIPEPTYPAFLNTITLAKGIIKFFSAYKYAHDEDGILRWVFDLQGLIATCTDRTKMIIITNPSNPTGACMTAQEIAILGAWCEDRGIYCIFDEAYENYFFDTPTTSATALVPSSKFLLRTGSFSKTYGMSGWRVGYVVGPAHIIEHCAAVQDGVIVCPTVISQYAALYALEHPEIAASYTDIVNKNRELAYKTVQSLVDQGIITCAKPQAGFFLFVETKEKDTVQLAHDLLAKEHVAVVPGKDFGPSGKSCLRICYARKTEVLQEGLDRFVRYFNRLQ